MHCVNTPLIFKMGQKWYIIPYVAIQIRILNPRKYSFVAVYLQNSPGCNYEHMRFFNIVAGHVFYNTGLLKSLILG